MIKSFDRFTQQLEKLAISSALANIVVVGSIPEHIIDILVSSLGRNLNAPRLFIIDNDEKHLASTRARFKDQPFVYSYAGATNCKDWPTADQVARFFMNQRPELRRQPLFEMLEQLSSGENRSKCGQTDLCWLDRIEQEFGVTQFDLAVIDGDDFTATRELERVYGARHIYLFGSNSFGGDSVWRRLLEDTDYELLLEDRELEGGAAVFQRRRYSADVPVHFFTIVLNGEPWIRYHEQVLQRLPFRWQWHIVEGVASLVHDTSWSVSSGGHIADSIHRAGRSIDGTTEYLDDLAARMPENVRIYRKKPGEFWDGKREMVNAPLANIQEECVLWQIDCDELWTKKQIVTLHDLFVKHPDKTAAWFWCKYFVGPEKAISTRYNYAQNPKQEWLRAWRFRPGMKWIKHEPPVLGRKKGTADDWEDVGRANPFWHEETEAHGLVFEHYAYVTREQADFKETYYGYAGARQKWQALQDYKGPPQKLSRFLDWVTDNTMLADCQRLGWTPIAKKDLATGRWLFRRPDQVMIENRSMRERLASEKRVRILIDAVYFQMLTGGIGRLWLSLIEEWKKTGFVDNIVMLDRGGTCPRVEGVTYRSIQPNRIEPVGDDATYLQRICDEEQADLFVSTYYSTPTRTPTVFMGYDMIPEVLGVGLDDPWWRQKRRAIQYAVGHIMISHSSARDLVRFFPGIPLTNVGVAYCSVADVFHKASPEEIAAFRQAHDLQAPFVLMIGERRGWQGYKNGILAFMGVAALAPNERPIIVCIGGAKKLEPEYRELIADSQVKHISLDDVGLRAAYSGAHALIYPSLYEGFGLPIAEAIACECPVITCANSSIPEVAGDGAIYVNPNAPREVTEAIQRLHDPIYRRQLIETGLNHIAKFNGAASAKLISDLYLQIIAKLREGALFNPATALDDVFAALRKNAELAQAYQRAEQVAFDAKKELAKCEVEHVRKLAELKQHMSVNGLPALS